MESSAPLSTGVKGIGRFLNAGLVIHAATALYFAIVADSLGVVDLPPVASGSVINRRFFVLVKVHRKNFLVAVRAVEGQATEVLSDMRCSTAKEFWRARPISVAIASFHVRQLFDFQRLLSLCDCVIG